MPHSPESLESLKRAPAMDGVLDPVLHRWSPRAFSDRPVSDADLWLVFEAARWAASSYNEQPWRFLVGRRGDSTYEKIMRVLVEGNQAWAKSAPVLILSVAKKAFTHSGQPNLHAWYDVGAATAYLSLQATVLGLHTHSMAGFDHDQARREFRIPEDFEPVAVTALGAAGDPESLPEMLKKMELSPRQRKSLPEIVFTEWEKPALPSR